VAGELVSLMLPDTFRAELAGVLEQSYLWCCSSSQYWL